MMAFFKIENGLTKRIDDTGLISPTDLNWLVDRLMIQDEILPERLLFIGRGKSNKLGCELKYLLALDSKGELALLHATNHIPETGQIHTICELCWALRYLTYDELHGLAKNQLGSNGVEIDSLSKLHTEFFELTQPVHIGRYNETQRIFIMAPNFDQNAIDSIYWNRSEVNINAYSFNIIEEENGDRLLAVETDVKGGSISSIMAAIGGAPSSLSRKIRSRIKRR
jgi:hypothetical protein